jgi:hypothetical protein
MDVDKTIEFLLENQARLQAMFEADKERAKEDSDRAKEDSRRAKEEMAAIRQILQETTLIQKEQARILVRIESQTDRHKEEIAGIQENLQVTTQRLAQLTATQQVTETKLQAFIDSLRHGRNGGSIHS